MAFCYSVNVFVDLLFPLSVTRAKRLLEAFGLVVEAECSVCNSTVSSLLSVSYPTGRSFKLH